MKKDNDIERVKEIESSIQHDVVTTSPMQEKSDFREALEVLMNDKYRRRKTILINEQVSGITILDVIGQMYDIPFIRGIVRSYAEWRTSGDEGKGRNDIVEIAKAEIARDLQKRDKDVIAELRK